MAARFLVVIYAIFTIGWIEINSASPISSARVKGPDAFVRSGSVNGRQGNASDAGEYTPPKHHVIQNSLVGQGNVIGSSIQLFGQHHIVGHGNVYVKPKPKPKPTYGSGSIYKPKTTTPRITKGPPITVGTESTIKTSTIDVTMDHTVTRIVDPTKPPITLSTGVVDITKQPPPQSTPDVTIDHTVTRIVDPTIPPITHSTGVVDSTKQPPTLHPVDVTTDRPMTPIGDPTKPSQIRLPSNADDASGNNSEADTVSIVAAQEDETEEDITEEGDSDSTYQTFEENDTPEDDFYLRNIKLRTGSGNKKNGSNRKFTGTNAHTEK